MRIIILPGPEALLGKDEIDWICNAVMEMRRQLQMPLILQLVILNLT
jgi:hypothetical protein